MASITLNKTKFLSGSLVAAGDTVTVSSAEARRLVKAGDAAWSSNATTQEWDNTDGKTITSLTGGALLSMDSILLSQAPLKAVIRVFLTADNGIQRAYAVTDATGLTADADGIIQPPDFDATACNKMLVRFL